VDYISSKSKVTSHGGRIAYDQTPVDRVRELEDFGVGEILLTSIENEGSFSGLDLQTATTVTRSTDLPVILNGGIGTSAHISQGIEKAEASAIGIGSYFVFQNESREVVLHYESYLRSN
jgi:cyclase